MEKGTILDYVIVYNVSNNSQPWYYGGYFNGKFPFNSQDYTKALKIAYEDEAKQLCVDLNNALTENNIGFIPYHVEEHKYFSKVADSEIS